MDVEGLGEVGPTMWRSRERFLDEGLVSDAVRPEIARSWVRSKQSGVIAAGDPATRHAEFDPGSRLLRLAAPILDRLADEVANADMVVILTDPSGLVLDRRAGTAALRRGLDRVLLAPGYLYSEETVGTNGIGTAAELRDVAWVVGSEHYAEWLRWLSCAGAPIRNPITGRVEGVIDLTCRLQDTTALMVPFIKEGARDIERRLYEDASQCDRDLLDRFVAVARRSSRPVVALNAQTVIANAAAARLLEPADHALLWNHGARAIETGSSAARAFRLAEGSLAAVRCIDFAQGDPEHGVVLEIDLERPQVSPSRARADSRPGRRLPASLPGRSLAWRQAWTAVIDHAALRVSLLLTGEPGTGKLAMARAAHDEVGDGGPFTVADAFMARVDGETTWLGQVRARLAEPGGTLLLRHVEALDARTANALGAVLEAVVGRAAPWVVATLSQATDGESGTDVSLADQFPADIRVPPLSERPEDLSDIVPALILRHAGEPGAHAAAELMQALMRADWPGNVRQLESVIQGMVARRSHGELTLRDLPPAYQRVPWRRLSPMERIERAAILHALEQTGGHKVRAAALLGIGRATLYRKLKELGIADPRETFA
jgi:transcriptional regulator of acetoin/glycerol metabolism